MKIKLLSIVILICFALTQNGCRKEESELKITYSKKTPIDKTVYVPPSQSNVNVYPNPFDKSVNVQLGGPGFGDRTVLIRSADGKFKEFKQVTDNFELDFSAEPKGIYYCEIKIGNVVYQKELNKLVD